MAQKLTLEEFRKIKKQLKFCDYKEHPKIQDNLLSYDLSDIPFEEWEDIDIQFRNNEVVDFSKTHANIDLNIIKFFPSRANFKGCNIRNLEKLQGGIKPENFDEKTKQENSDIFLSDNIPQDLKDKIYNINSLSIKDVNNLSKEQLNELSLKLNKIVPSQNLIGLSSDKDNIIYSVFYRAFGLEKMVEFYNLNRKEYEDVYSILSLYPLRIHIKPIVNRLKDTDVKDIKKTCFDIYKEILVKSYNIEMPNPEEFEPKDFIEENKELFLIDKNIPDAVKERYYSRSLKIDDVIEYSQDFKNIPLDNFINSEHKFFELLAVYELGEYQKLVQKYPLVFKHLSDNKEIEKLGWQLNFQSKKDLENCFLDGIKKYILKEHLIISEYTSYGNGNIKYKHLPKWIESLDFNYMYELKEVSDLLNYDNKTFIMENSKQQILINIFGIDNLKRLENETKIFSLNGNTICNKGSIFKIIQNFINSYNSFNIVTNFKNGLLQYEKFEEEFAKLLDYMRGYEFFSRSDNYSKIMGNFREKHPEIFIDESAPKELVEAFYKGKITPEFLFQKDNYIPFLIDKNFSNTLDINIGFAIIIGGHPIIESFVPKYIEKYGNKKFLKLLIKYGKILNDITIQCTENQFNNEDLLDDAIKKSIKNYIIENNSKRTIGYEYLKDVPDFYSKYPELFVDFNNIEGISENVRKDLEKKYYSGKFAFKYIRMHPQLIKILENKNLEIPFGGEGTNDRKHQKLPTSDLLLKDMYGNKKFLELCLKYGRYMNFVVQDFVYKSVHLGKNNKFYNRSLTASLDFNQISKIIEIIIVNRCTTGKFRYSELDAPEFLKEQHPELFLSVDAPEELKEYYYGRNNKEIDFKILKKHKEWLPYLKGKLIAPTFIRALNAPLSTKQYFELFGEEKGLLLGIKKPETVEKVIHLALVRQMKEWYRKTGFKFIPDYVVMKNLDISESDKFLSNTTNWNKLMKLERFSTSIESREAMLKLAYSFGVFDGDKRGFNKIYELLTSIPKTTNLLETSIIDNFDDRLYDITTLLNIKNMTTEKQLDIIINHFNKYYNDGNILKEFVEQVKKDKLDLDLSKPAFSQIYKKNNDGTRTLTINQQKYPNVTNYLRKFLETGTYMDCRLLTPDKLHQLFGGFKLEYNKDFREFLLDNLDLILSYWDYQTYIASIQKQFKEIKTINSNRKLTLDLAISYVQNNKYEDVEIGNEGAAIVSAIAGYTQEDFNTLQKIYNYGKQRVFSSIPRIENKNEKYNYEILRLDDPLAMAIGTLTDCCQEIGNIAEVCMEHSMIDKNGRVFVVRDKEGNIISQSWVWRNKDVLCFDNIEIPDKAFGRVENREKFTEEVYEIYKMAAHELIEKDEDVYKKLLDDKKITEEQYEGLRLRKVTVGIGYNDIRAAIEKNAKKDYDRTMPLSFKKLVELNNELYTSDSRIQYILEEQTDRKKYDVETIQVYNDLYTVYDDSNFKEKELLSLGKLEINTKEYSDVMDILYDTKENLVSAIADLYNLDSKNTKVIMHPNFAIIYEIDDNKVKIADLFYNTKIENNDQSMDIIDVVVMQIRLAIEQIRKDKEIDISKLDKNQKEIYNKAMNLKKELDDARGIKK